MKKDNITRFPVKPSQRRKNSLGPLHVECEISGRSFKFHEKSGKGSDVEYITVDVMAPDFDEEKDPKKICEMVVTREDLMEALKRVSPKNENGDE